MAVPDDEVDEAVWAEVVRDLAADQVIRERLVLALSETRRKFDANDDDWQFSLLGTLREYLRATAIDADLILPVQVFRYQILDRTLRDREAAHPGQPRKDVGEALALALAAAAVSVLHERGEGVPEAVRVIAKASGLDARRVRSFRDRISRRTAPRIALAAHSEFVAELRDWPTFDSLGALTKFVR